MKCVGAVMRSQLLQHLLSSRNIELKRVTTVLQTNIEDAAKKRKVSKAEMIGQDTFEAFITANVPLKKLTKLRG